MKGLEQHVPAPFVSSRLTFQLLHDSGKVFSQVVASVFFSFRINDVEEAGRNLSRFQVAQYARCAAFVVVAWVMRTVVGIACAEWYFVSHDKPPYKGISYVYSITIDRLLQQRTFHQRKQQKSLKLPRFVLKY